MAQQAMYPALANSPGTEIATELTSAAVTISVLDATKLPAAPNLLTIGTDDNPETVLYTGKSGNNLTGCTRGFNGTTAQSWIVGSKVARYFTAYDHDAFRGNIVDHEERIESIKDTANAAATKAETYEKFTLVNEQLAETAKMVRLDAYSHLVPNKEMIPNPDNWDWSNAFQAALQTNIGIIQFPRKVKFTKSIYLKNDVTIIGDGHAFGTQIYLGSEFYTRSDNFMVDGLPVMFVAATEGVPRPAGAVCSHFKMKNVHLLSRPWEEFVTGEEIFEGREQAIAIYGTFFEGNFEDVSHSGWQTGFDIVLNNTKITGASIALGNGISYKIQGPGTIMQVSSVLGDNAFEIGERSEGLTIIGVHIESTHMPFVVKKHCQNVSIITPHLFNIRGVPALIDPSSSVYWIGTPTTRFSYGKIPDCEVNHSIPIPSTYVNTAAIGLIPDGELQSSDTNNWTVANGTIKKTIFDMEVFANGEQQYTGRKILECTPSAGFKLSNTLASLGMLDFEFSALGDQSLRVVIKDSTNTTTYDSGNIQGEVNTFSANSLKQAPTKICGFVPRSGTGPYTIEVTCTRTSKFSISKLEMYHGRELSKFSGTSNITPTGNYIHGFPEYSITGSAASGLQFALATPNEAGGKYKVVGFAKSDVLTHVTLKDVSKTNSEDRLNIMYGDYNYFEMNVSATTYAQLIKRAEEIKVYGVGSLRLFDMENGNLKMTDAPSFGWFDVGEKIINSAQSFGGIEYWIKNALGTWSPHQNGIVTSISTTPLATGFIAVQGGIAYISTARTGPSDWKQITN